jgi:uncharacterized glyoxalase superfamily protein PhnB
MTNRSVPVDTLLPHLVYSDVVEAIRWLNRTFGFVEHYRYGNPVSGAQMTLGGAVIMLGSSGKWTQFLTIFVDDVDAHYARAKAAGAKIFEDLHETVYGERQYGAEDFAGNRWLFSQHVRDVSPEEWGATITSR